MHRTSGTLCILHWLSALSSFHRPTCLLRNRLYHAAKMTSIHLPYSIRYTSDREWTSTADVHFQSRASAIAFMQPLTGISPPRFHIYTDTIPTDDDNRDCTIHVPRLLLLLRSNILTRGLIRTIIISFVRAFHTKCFLIFPCKVSASGILKGSRSTLILRFFQKFLGQVCLIPKSFKP